MPPFMIFWLEKDCAMDKSTKAECDVTIMEMAGPGEVNATERLPRDEPIIFLPARGTLRRGFIRDSWLLLYCDLDRVKGGRGKRNI